MYANFVNLTLHFIVLLNFVKGGLFFQVCFKYFYEHLKVLWNFISGTSLRPEFKDYTSIEDLSLLLRPNMRIITYIV